MAIKSTVLFSVTIKELERSILDHRIDRTLKRMRKTVDAMKAATMEGSHGDRHSLLSRRFDSLVHELNILEEERFGEERRARKQFLEQNGLSRTPEAV